MKIRAIILAGVCAVSMMAAACSGSSGAETTAAQTTAAEETAASSAETSSQETETAESQRGASGVDQLAGPQSGDTVAIMTIKDYGEVRIRLFPEQAPKAVESFVGLARSGYYDGVTFHRVIADFMLQGGDPTGTGKGGESYFGSDFEDEISPDLFPLQGSLCMGNQGQGTSTNGSQFFLVTCADIISASKLGEVRDKYAEKGITLAYSTMSRQCLENYEEVGGAYWLYSVHTVFGQVYEGMDILLEAQNVEVDENNKPLEDLVIESIVIETYE